MKVIEVTEKDKEKFDRFVRNHPLGSVQQCWDWGAFQSKSGQRDKFYALILEDEKGAIAASAIVIRQRLPLGKCWLYCPRGPVADYSKHEHLSLLLEKISSIAGRENAVFFRFDPPVEAGFAPDVKRLMKGLKARPAHAHYQPESTLILDLRHEPEELLRRMKPKGRYNIKVAQKHGVTVTASESGSQYGGPEGLSGRWEADMEAFYSLLKETAARDGFRGHPLSYYKNMLEILGPQKSTFEVGSTSKVETPARPSAKLYLARHGGKVLAGMIVTFFRDTATYYFGASSSENRYTMAPYLLHWKAIRDARAAGYHYYDFFGISPEEPEGAADGTPPRGSAKARPHPWQKVTEFKLKFGGERVNYYPAQEIVYRPFWYAMIRLAKWAIGIVRK